MADVEVASAYIALTTKMPGVSKDIAEALSEGEKAGEAAGEKTGQGWGRGLKTTLGIGAAAAVAGAVVAFKGLYDIGAVFDDVTDTIRVGTGAQGEALDGLVQSAKNVGLKVPAEFEKIGPTIADLNTRLGLSGETLETVASQYLEAGRILGQDIDINQTTAAFNAFGIEGKNVSGAMDTLFQVSQATGLGMNELAGVVQAAAPVLQNLGFSFEESAALAGSLDKAGLNTQQVMASLSKGLVTLAKDGEEPQEAFRRVTSELQGFVDTGDTAAALDLASQVFGTRGASQFVGALQSGVLNMNDLMAATGATGDTILGVGEETADFAERWQVTMNTALVALEPLATAVFTAIGDGLAAAMPFLQELGAWVSDNIWVIAAIAAVIGVTLVAAFVAWTVSIWAMNAALLASPITWIIIAIVALIAAIVFLAMNWDAVVAWVTEVWSGFISWITEVGEGFAAWWTELWATVGQFIADVWNNIVTAVSDYFQSLWNGLQLVGAMISDWWMGLWSAVGKFIADVWRNIVSAVQGAWNGLWSWITGVVKGFLSWWGVVWKTVGKVWEDIWGGLGDFLKGVWNGIVGYIRGYINTIIGLINGIINGINGVAGAIGGAIGIDIRIPNIPRLAAGGIIAGSSTGTLALVGEAGRGRDEAVIPLPPDWRQNGLGTSTGGTQDVNVVGPIELGESTRRALARDIAQFNRVDARMGVV